MRIFRPLGLGLIALALGLILVLGFGHMYQVFAQAKHRRVVSLQGRLIPVSGRTIYMDCRGTGHPTVVLESGVTSFAATWDLVVQNLASRTRVCAYDRAGLGWSAETRAEREPRDVPEDLYNALQAAGEPPPYIIVGHSLGAMFAILFAETHRPELQGLVLIDPPHPDMFRVVPYTKKLHHSLLRRLYFGELLAQVGVLDAFSVNRALIQSLPPSARSQAAYLVNDPKHLRNSRAEVLIWPSIARAVAAAHAYTSLPVLVVCPAEPLKTASGARFRAALTDLQARFVTTNPHSSQVVMEGAAHKSVLLENDLASRLAEHIFSFAQETRGDDARGTRTTTGPAVSQRFP